MANHQQPRSAAALVIGVDRYAHGIEPLQFAVKDAEALAGVLVDPNVCQFPPDRIKLLTNAGADRDALVDALVNWLPKAASDAELVVVYFAGHGKQHPPGDKGEGYLLPHDTDPDNPAARGVSMSDFAGWIGNLTAKAVLVCLDCCHAGAATRTRDPGGPSGPAARDMKGIKSAALKKVAGANRFVMAACGDDQKSIEDANLGHGLFTYYLLEGIKGGADRDKDGQVRVSALFEYVHDGVVKLVGAADQKPAGFGSGLPGVYVSAPALKAKTAVPPRLTAEQLLGRFATAPADELPGLLRAAAKLADRRLIPTAVTYFSDKWPPEVRRAARKVLRAVGRDAAFDELKALARQRVAALAPVLDGLATLPAGPALVDLLTQIAILATGNARIQATELRDRKRLGLELEKLKELFREIGSEYEPQRALGLGQFAAAYLARDVRTEMAVVVRVLRPEYVAHVEICRQFREASLQSVRYAYHESLATTLSVRDHPNRDLYFAVRRHMDGATLREVVTGRPPETPPFRFTPLQGVEVLCQLAGGLAVLHENGVVHGAVKSSNIFVNPRNRVVLGDVAPAGLPLGTGSPSAFAYRYFAPEVLYNEPPGAPADLYALGCVAYEVFTGLPPFVADTAGELTRAHLGGTVPSFTSRGVSLPPRLEALVQQLLYRVPGDRPTAERALHELESIREPLRRPPDPGEPSDGNRPAAPNATANGNVRLVADAAIAGYRPARTLASVADDRLLLATQQVLDLDAEDDPPAPKPLPPEASRPSDSGSEFELTLDVDEAPAPQPAEERRDIFQTDFEIPALTSDGLPSVTTPPAPPESGPLATAPPVRYGTAAPITRTRPARRPRPRSARRRMCPRAWGGSRSARCWARARSGACTWASTRNWDAKWRSRSPAASG